MHQIHAYRAVSARATSSCRANHVMAFQNIKKATADPMQDLKKRTDNDQSPTKVDIGAGVYRNEGGSYHEFESVKYAKTVLDANNIGHDYNPTTGIPSFGQNAAQILFGKSTKALQEGKIATVQTVAGTGANRIGAAFLRRNLYSPSDRPIAFIGEPAWGNYRPLFENAGFQVNSYQHCSVGATTPDLSAVLSAMREAPQRSVFILQASCHNPTGLDYSRNQWQNIAQMASEQQHFAFFDAAYIGFGSGHDNAAEEDAWALRYFADQGIDLLVCQSFSKTFGLYAERVGALHVICQTHEIAGNVFDQLRAQIRWEHSSSPAYGARLVDIILGSSELVKQWRQELSSAAARIESNRKVLYRLLKDDLKTPGSWEHIIEEKGLFSYMQLKRSQIDELERNHHIYLPPNGRVNVAGLTTSNIKDVARAIDAVIR